MGLAHPVPVQHCSRDRRSVDSFHDRGVASVPEDQGLEAGSENADHRRDPHVSEEHPAGDGRALRGKRLLLHLRDVHSGLCHAGAGHEQAGHIEWRSDRRGDRSLHDSGLRRALGPSRAPTGVHFRRRFLGRDVIPVVHAARNQKPATRLDRDCAGSGCRPRRHVRPTGGLSLRTVWDQSALQRRVARLQSCVDLRRSAIAAHRHWTHDRLQAGNVADLRLYDRTGANHDRFGLFREGNADRNPRPESGDADHRGVVATSEG